MIWLRKMKKNKVMIIGLGNIGLGINSLNKNLKFLSHAFAIKSCPNLLLDIGIDNNLERRKIFKNNFNVETHKDISSLKKKSKFDIVVVSVNTQNHYKIILDIINKIKTKIILVEKPFCSNVNQARKLKKILDKKNIKCFINYPRRFLNGISYLKNLIQDKFFFGKINISGGLINNGCHFIDLMNYLFDGNPEIKISSKKIPLKKKDYSRSFKLIYRNSILNFDKQNLNSQKFTIDLINKNYLIKVNQINDRNNIPKINIKILNRKNKKLRYFKEDISSYQKKVYLEIMRYIKTKNYNLSDINDAIKVKQITNNILN